MITVQGEETVPRFECPKCRGTRRYVGPNSNGDAVECDFCDQYGLVTPGQLDQYDQLHPKPASAQWAEPAELPKQAERREAFAKGMEEVNKTTKVSKRKAKYYGSRLEIIGIDPADLYARTAHLATQFFNESDIKTPKAKKYAMAEQLAMLVMLRRAGFQKIAQGDLSAEGFKVFVAVCANVLKLTQAMGLARIPEEEGALPWEDKDLE